MAVIEIQDKLRGLIVDQYVYMRPVVFGLVPLVRDRIHVQGKKADGSDIGVYSNGYLKARQRANRGNSKKVILSLTRQMEQDMVPVAEGDEYGIGYTNQHNFDKAQWTSDSYPGTFELSNEEIDIAEEIIIDIINDVLS